MAKQQQTRTSIEMFSLTQFVNFTNKLIPKLNRFCHYKIKIFGLNFSLEFVKKLFIDSLLVEINHKEKHTQTNERMQKFLSERTK